MGFQLKTALVLISHCTKIAINLISISLFPLHSTFLEIVSKNAASSDVNQAFASAYSFKRLILLGSGFYIQIT